MRGPDTRFAWNGDVSLAYQIVSQEGIDLLYVPGAVSNVDVMWEDSRYSAFLERLASFSRLIVMDRRGTGCSERFSPSEVAPLEVMVDDIVTVLDAVGSERAALFSFEEGTDIVAMTAASRPDRISHLVMLDPVPCWVRNDEITWEWSRDRWDEQIERFRDGWGTEDLWRQTSHVIPSIAGKDREQRWLARFQRLTQPPGAAIAEMRKHRDTDLRRLLPTIHVPTLVLHRSDDEVVDVRSTRYVAEHVPGAAFVEIPGRDHIPLWEETDALADEIGAFVTGVRPSVIHDRILTTVLFTDIVGSTQRQAAVGDHAWRAILADHHQIVRSSLERWRGVEHDTAGDGFYATFDGPARAIRCARDISEQVRELQLEIRAGVHTGECEVMGEKLGGLAVTIGARVMSHARASEVLVSQTVKDLVAGSGIGFEDAGAHGFKGVPDVWRLYRVAQ